MITFSFTIARPFMIVKADGTLASGNYGVNRFIWKW